MATKDQAEIANILQELDAANGNKTRAAKQLGIDRSTLFRKIKKLGIRLKSYTK